MVFSLQTSWYRNELSSSEPQIIPRTWIVRWCAVFLAE